MTQEQIKLLEALKSEMYRLSETLKSSKGKNALDASYSALHYITRDLDDISEMGLDLAQTYIQDLKEIE